MTCFLNVSVKLIFKDLPGGGLFLAAVRQHVSFFLYIQTLSIRLANEAGYMREDNISFKKKLKRICFFKRNQIVDRCNNLNISLYSKK